MRFATTASSLALLLGAALTASAHADLAQVMEGAKPETKQCGAKGGDECRTAAQAAPHMSASLAAYNVSCAQEAACLVGLMLLESDGLRYKHNVSPGRPGQGTANMQMADFNLAYAKDVAPQMPAELKAAADAGALSDEQKKAVLALVTDDKFNFGSAAWFLKTQCVEAKKPGADAARKKLREGGLDGCAAYLETCVGVPPTDAARAALNQKVYQAMGVEKASQCVPLEGEHC